MWVEWKGRGDKALIRGLSVSRQPSLSIIGRELAEPPANLLALEASGGKCRHVLHLLTKQDQARARGLTLPGRQQIEIAIAAGERELPRIADGLS